MLRTVLLFVWLAVLLSALSAPLTSAATANNDRPRSSGSVVLTEVQATSLLVAYWRHLETQRDSLGPPERPPPTPALIQDPFAHILLDKLGMGHDEHIARWKDSPILAFGINCMAIRIRAIDDWLMEGQGAAGAGARRRQIVNLGAGMCTRPYRLGWDEEDEVTVYEVEKDIALLKAKREALMQYPTKCSRLVDVEADVTSSKKTLARPY